MRHLLHETEQAQNLNKNPFYLEEAAYLSRGQLLYNINLLFFSEEGCSKPCGMYATCDSHVCQCNSGYQGNGYHCSRKFEKIPCYDDCINVDHIKNRYPIKIKYLCKLKLPKINFCQINKLFLAFRQE